MSDKHTITLTVDRSELFDRVASLGDGGSALGSRLVGLLLTGGGIIDRIGLGLYGVAIVACDPTPSAGIPDTTQDGRA